MLRIFLLLISIHAGLSYGMQCSLGEQNFLEQILKTCPGILDSSDKEYCCYSLENSKFYCCDFIEFAKLATWTSVAVIVAIAVVVFCVSCICCVCCRRYRRRNQGTVYEHVQVPHVVQVIHSPPAANVLPQSNYVVNSVATAAPPPATPHDMYAKPPPYNTSYIPPPINNMDQQHY